MDSLVLLPGGRPFTNDDLQTLQGRDTLLGLPALLQGLGPCIVSGCTLTATGSTYTVSAGMVWANGVLLDFLGASNVTLPALLTAGTATTTDSRPYRTGSTQAARQQRYIVLMQSSTPLTNAVFLEADEAPITIFNRIDARTRQLGEIGYIANVTGYDSTGKGNTETTRGWALCNGQNGTFDLRQKFIAGYDPSRTGYGVIGQGGGAETVTLTADQNGRHSHGNGNYNRLVRVAPVGGPAVTPGQAGNAQQPGEQETDIFTTQPMSDSGTGAPHENRPPFVALALRQWIGF